MGSMREKFRCWAGGVGHLAVDAVAGAAGLLLLVVTVVAFGTIPAGIGIPLLVLTVSLTRRLADAHRRRAAAVLGRPVPSPYAPRANSAPARFVRIFRDPATWRDLLWLPADFALSQALFGAAVTAPIYGVHFLLAPLERRLDLPFNSDVVSRAGTTGAWLLSVLGALLLAVVLPLPRWLVSVKARLDAMLLAPSTTALLATRVEHLTETRAAAVDISAVELRRIERDLHDGAQARLVSLTMDLGMAEDVIDADPQAAKALLAGAHQSANAALTELRQLVRGIHPPVLADRGLAGAVPALALSSSLPVDLDLRLERRLPAPIESAAYFAIAEALANAIRHSGAPRVYISIVDIGSTLRITVRDEGCGGADPAAGTGLIGLRRRLSALDATVRITSPIGGPTDIVMELPCAS